MRPHRICALCPAKIREKERLCSGCQDRWEEHLTQPWLTAIIEYSNYEHNLELRDYGRTIPIEKVKTI